MSKSTKKERCQSDMPYQSSHLFLVRVWLEKTTRDTYRVRLHGRVQDVSTGQAHYFRGSTELTKVLCRMLPSSHYKSDETVTDGESKDLANDSA
jgi:hypothetical protein